MLLSNNSFPLPSDTFVTSCYQWDLHLDFCPGSSFSRSSPTSSNMLLSFWCPQQYLWSDFTPRGSFIVIDSFTHHIFWAPVCQALLWGGDAQWTNRPAPALMKANFYWGTGEPTSKCKTNWQHGVHCLHWAQQLWLLASMFPIWHPALPQSQHQKIISSFSQTSSMVWLPFWEPNNVIIPDTQVLPVDSFSAYFRIASLLPSPENDSLKISVTTPQAGLDHPFLKSFQ